MVATAEWSSFEGSLTVSTLVCGHALRDRPPIELTTERAVGVLIATLVMCAISGLLARRKVRKLDPAEVL